MSVWMEHSLVILPGVNEQSAANTVTIASAGTSNSREYRELASFSRGTFILDVTAASGTSPTLNVTVEGQDPISQKWHTIVTFPQQTAATGGGVITPITVNPLTFPNYRAKFVVGGTTPSFTFSLSCVSVTEESV